MWRLYRDNTIQTMRERHDNFDFSKVIRSHNRRANLVQIGSFIGPRARPPVSLPAKPSPPEVHKSDLFLEQTSHRKSKSPTRLALAAANDFHPDETLPDSESRYLSSILGIASRDDPPLPETDPLKSY